MQCPICDDPLDGHAEVTAGEVTTLVCACPTCGRFALGPRERELAASVGTKAKFNLMARLETRSIRAEADGTVVLTAAHFGVKD